MEWAVAYQTWIVTGNHEHIRVWKYKIFDDADEAMAWYRDFHAWLPYDELDLVEPPVPFVDGRPQEMYVDNGCKGQISMFDSTFRLELDAELESAI